MLTNKKAPNPLGGFGATKNDRELQSCIRSSPVPILTHYPRHRKRRMRRRRLRLVWTPVNVSLLILLAAILFIVIVNAITADPFKPEIVSMSNSVFRV